VVVPGRRDATRRLAAAAGGGGGAGAEAEAEDEPEGRRGKKETVGIEVGPT
jgi:hypothetical protein